MARRRRQNKGGNLSHQHDILDGKAQIFRVAQSGDVFQFRMWIQGEKTHYRKSLKTRDLTTALERGRELGMKLMTNIRQNKKVFGMSLREAVDLYLEDRQQDVKGGVITQGRINTIMSQMNRVLEILGEKTKVSELEPITLFDYERDRKVLKKNVKPVTIRNEQSTINHMVKFLHRKGICHFDSFEFRRMSIRQDDVGKRDSFTPNEYRKLTYFMRTYSSKAKASDEAERLEKLLIRDYVLISTNTCMRVGELRQLTWGDIERIETAYDADEKQIKLAHINVRPETSKVRRHRKIICRGGEYFERLKERQEFTGKDDLVFSSVNGTAKLSGHKWANHWNALMDGIGISRKEWKEERNLTWYSLRHFGITMRILAGVNVLDVSKLAGTSISHIENTYLKYQEEQMKTQAMKTFTFNSDGTIEHKE